jgi:hypothetical protein
LYLFALKEELSFKQCPTTCVLQIQMLTRTTGKEEDEAIRHLFQRMAILLVKGNAASWYIESHPLPTVNGEL